MIHTLEQLIEFIKKLNKEIYVFIDNGHGVDTNGKYSPKKADGTRFYEWKWSRLAAKKLAEKLEQIPHVHPVIIVPGDKDVGLIFRAGIANSTIKKVGAANCILISIHNNAAGGNDKWMTAQGYEVWTTRGQNNSDKLAECLYDYAEEFLVKDEAYKVSNNAKVLRTDKTDGDRDKEKDWTIIKNALCPAVLVENLFQDNKKDVAYLESEHGQDILTDIMLYGSLEYFYQKYKK